MRRKSIKDTEVYDLISKIPAGKITTYGDIAKFLGHPKSSRQIGRILNNNPTPFIIPCHRVVQSNGRIGGYAFGIELKKEILQKEGLEFQGPVIKKFEEHRIIFAKSEGNKDFR